MLEAKARLPVTPFDLDLALVPSLKIPTADEDRGLGTGGTVWWMPTTHEFGPNGSYGDWDYHEQLATRFGASTARSRENRQLQTNTSPENTQIKLADSLNVVDLLEADTVVFSREALDRTTEVYA